MMDVTVGKKKLIPTQPTRIWDLFEETALNPLLSKKNCIMLAYEESGSTVGERGKRVVFDARGLEQNYLWRDLTDATLEEDIESVDCYCGDEIPDEFSGSLQRSRSGAVDPKSNMSKRKIKKCPPVPDHVCAILFDDDDCDKGDWDAPLIINSGESKSFSILSDYRNDIESFIVREGCVLEAFDDSDYDDDSLRASAINGDLYVNLDDHPNEDYDDLEEDIESIRCNCNF